MKFAVEVNLRIKELRAVLQIFTDNRLVRNLLILASGFALVYVAAQASIIMLSYYFGK